MISRTHARFAHVCFINVSFFVVIICLDYFAFCQGFLRISFADCVFFVSVCVFLIVRTKEARVLLAFRL